MPAAPGFGTLPKADGVVDGALRCAMTSLRAAPIFHFSPQLIPNRNALLSIDAAWEAADNVVANAEAGQISATFAFEEKMASLTRKPDAETNSPLDTWDATIVMQVAYGGTIYQYLLPHGREGLTTGTYEQRLVARNSKGVSGPGPVQSWVAE